MKTRSDTFQFEKELDWEKPAPGIRRQMMGYDGQLMMVKVEFEEGAVGAVVYYSREICFRIFHSKPCSMLGVPHFLQMQCIKSVGIQEIQE